MAKIRPLTPDLQKKAEEELYEVPSRIESDLAYIREWLSKQPHINADPDDQSLIAFLRGCKYSLERTKEKIDMYYTMHTALPEIFKDRNVNDKKFKELMELQTFFPLPEPDDHGRRIFIIRPGNHDPSKISYFDFVKMNFLCIDILLRDDDNVVVGGIVNLIDCSDVSLALASQFTPSAAKKTLVCSQEAYPIRPKGIHYVNTPSLFDTLFLLIKSLTKEKVKKRIFVHGSDMTALHKHIPQRLLPAEYGGSAGTMKEINDAWIKKLEMYHDWCVEDGKCGVDESKRLGKPKTQQDLFGLEGSFRKLDFD